MIKKVDHGYFFINVINENVFYEKDGEVACLNEDYAQAYPTLNEYINDYTRVIKSHVSNVGEKNRLIRNMQEIKQNIKILP